MRQFIFTLGMEFSANQTNYRIGNLPQEWNTTDWPTLLVLCRDYYNSVNPKGLLTLLQHVLLNLSVKNRFKLLRHLLQILLPIVVTFVM